MKNPLFINPFHKPSDTILVAGGGRSGTTWNNENSLFFMNRNQNIVMNK